MKVKIRRSESLYPTRPLRDEDRITAKDVLIGLFVISVALILEVEVLELFLAPLLGGK